MTETLFNRLSRFGEAERLSDCHLHTTWTDGQCTVPQVLAQAEALGLRRVGFTDHVRRSSTYCRAYAGEIRRLGQGSGMRVLVGFEAKAMDAEGHLDMPAECRELADFVIGSVHSIPAGGTFQRPEALDPKALEEAEHRFALALAACGEADVLGHAGGMSLALHGSFDLGRMEEIIRACAETGTAFEVNARYHLGILDWLADRLERWDPPVSLGSDAHDVRQVGRCAGLLPGGGEARHG